MYINKTKLYRGCLLSSIAHAIMTNVYPSFSYEQSWDGTNFSIQDSRGTRCTITFCEDYCVGGIRNESEGLFSRNNYNDKYKQMLLNKFPYCVINTAEKEALQYLLVEYDGQVLPNITSIFWCNDNSFFYHSCSDAQLSDDMSLLYHILLPEEKAIEALVEYYNIDDCALHLIKHLFNERLNDFSKALYLSACQIKMFPGESINNECKQSLQELNIYC